MGTRRYAQPKTTTVSVGLRMEPKLKHLVDIMSRGQRRSLTAIFEAALEAYASGDERFIASETWSTDSDELLIRLYQKAPHLCSFDEEVAAKALITTHAV